METTRSDEALRFARKEAERNPDALSGDGLNRFPSAVLAVIMLTNHYAISADTAAVNFVSPPSHKRFFASVIGAIADAGATGCIKS